MLSNTPALAPRPAQLPPALQPAMPGNGSAGGPSFAQFLNGQPDVIEQPPHTEPVPADVDSAAERTTAAAPSATQTRRHAATTPGAKQPTAAAPLPSRSRDTADQAQRANDAIECDVPAKLPTADTKAQDDTQTAGLNEFTQLIGLAVPAPAVQAPGDGQTLPGAQPTPALPQALVAQPAQAMPLAQAAQATPLAQAAQAVHATQPTQAGRSTQPPPSPQMLQAPSVSQTIGATLNAPAILGVPTARTERVVDEEREPASRSGTETVAAPAPERRPAELPVSRAADAAHTRSGGQDLAAADKAFQRSAASDALQAGTAPGSGSTPAAPTPSDALPPSFAAVLAQAMPAATAAVMAAPVSASGQLQAPVHSSAFGPELGASVSLLAVDGVQQAELQLNPADMGPVSVQIVVDGAQAHVSFHAAQAETRQALEQSLPDLAAALQGQGLTLSGGGVFQQASRDTQDGDAEPDRGDDRSARNSAGDARTAAARGASEPARRSVGLLDTFA